MAVAQPLFPWTELEVEGERLVRKVAELDSYHAEVPSDVDPQRVAQDLMTSPTDRHVVKVWSFICNYIKGW